MFKNPLIFLLILTAFTSVSFGLPYYVGNNAETCGTCHAAYVDTWKGTLHSVAQDSLVNALGYSCLSCHNTGWDTEAANYGADDYVTPGENNSYTITDEAAFAKVKNIQCETCHGALGNEDHTFLGYTEHREAAVVTFAADNCGTCHQGSHHPTFTDWQTSLHAVSKETSIPGGSFAFIKSNPNCAACHTAEGFVQFIGMEDWEPTVEAPGEDGHSITCAACHDPHEHANGGQLRLAKEELCVKCHNPEYNPDMVAEPTAETEVHHSTAFMFDGKGGYEYDGWEYPSSAHTHAVTEKCVTCHVYTTPYQGGTPEVPAFTGHSFEPQLGACTTCHSSFNVADSSFDYRGKQTEVAGLVEELHNLLASASSADSTTDAFNRARFNLEFVENDGSMGIHNTQYAVALLQSALANFKPTAVESNNIAPVAFALYQNYPNPFNPTTTVAFDLQRAGKVEIKLFNAMGQEIKTILSEYRPAGSHEIALNMSDLPSGVYVYTLTTGEYNNSKKLVLMK